MEYAKIDGSDNVLEYPVAFKDIKDQLQHVSLPKGQPIPDSVLADLGYVKVNPTDKPVGTTDKYVAGTPTKDGNGDWNQVWDAVALSSQELADKKADLKKIVESKREQVEEDGIVYDLGGTDLLLLGSDVTITKLTSAKIKADAANASSQSLTLDWRDGANVWHVVNEDDIVAMFDALFNHVKKCFETQKQVNDLIDNETVLTEDAVLAKYDELFNA